MTGLLTVGITTQVFIDESIYLVATIDKFESLKIDKIIISLVFLHPKSWHNANAILFQSVSTSHDHT